MDKHDIAAAWFKMLWTWLAVGVSVMTPLQALQAVAAIAATIYSVAQTWKLWKQRDRK